MGEPAIPTAAQRGVALDFATHILDRIRNDEPDRIPTPHETWLLAATLKFYAPILEAAHEIAKHWHEQEGINVVLLNALEDEIYG